MASPTRVADRRCITGEGPIWHPDEQRLYWVDIPNGRLFRYDPETDEHEQCFERDGSIGGVTVQADGSLLLFVEGGRIGTWSGGGELDSVIVDGVPDERDSRFNDVIAAPRGHVFCGTMPTDDRSGRLYRLNTDGDLELLREDTALPNGMGFTPDREQLYVTDSASNVIHRFDYDEETGEIETPEVFVDTSDRTGVPDGMTVDAAKHVWSAFWNGGRVVRFAPDGTAVDEVSVPARKVSSITFGGPGYLDAYVTTALGPAEGEPGTRETEGDGAGALFRVDLGLRGLPEFRSRVNPG